MRWLVLWLVLLTACSERAESAVSFGIDGGDPLRGRELLDRYECVRCHQPQPEVDGRNCLSCHTAIGAGARHVLPGRPRPVQVEGWAATIQHYREIPSLHGIGKLLRRDWIVRFLEEPYDLRPRLAESMPHLGIDHDEARDIAAFLAAAPKEPPYFAERRMADYRVDLPPLQRGDVARGEEIYRDAGCIACHLMSGAVVAPAVTADRLEARKLMLAVDLRHTRDRFEPTELVPWILEPTYHKADAAMPNLGLTYQQARDVAAFIMEAELAPLPDGEVPERLPLLEEPVTFERVFREVFGKTCVHCHDEADLGELGDGGPGNVGGFGFQPRGLSFASYESIFAGYLEEGVRRSIFAPEPDGTPLLVAVLLARQREEALGQRAARTGMPLSLPAVTPEQLQLVESWIAQGRPR